MATPEMIEALNKATGGAKPTVGIICGSGLSGLSKTIDSPIVVKYEDIPGFPSTTIAGHTGELVFGNIEKVKVVCMRGRFHSYEGHDMQTVTLPVKLFKALGVETLIVTNAAGGLNRSYQVGDLMLMSDHIGLPLMAGKHPLLGPNDETFGGARFTPMSDAYCPALRQLVWETALPLGMTSYMRRSGTYVFLSGPDYETGAEAQMLLNWGGDSVGMSTVPEVTVARHCGMRVLGLSLITNSVRLPGDGGPVASHEEVLETVDLRSSQLQNLVRIVVSKLDAESWAKLEPRLITAAASHKVTTKKCLKERIQSLDLSNMTPLQALTELHELKKLAASS